MTQAKQTHPRLLVPFVCTVSCLLLAAPQTLHAADRLKVHGIFRSNMVLQRDKPIPV